MLTSNIRNAQNVWMNTDRNDKTEEAGETIRNRHKSPSACSIDSETRSQSQGGGIGSSRRGSFIKNNQYSGNSQSRKGTFNGRGRHNKNFGSPVYYNSNGSGYSSMYKGNNPRQYQPNMFSQCDSPSFPVSSYQGDYRSHMYNQNYSRDRSYHGRRQNRSPSPQSLSSSRVRHDSSGQESGGGRSSAGSHIHRYRAAGTAPSPSPSIISSPYKEMCDSIKISEAAVQMEHIKVAASAAAAAAIQNPAHYQTMINGLPEREIQRILSLNPQLQYIQRLMPITNDSSSPSGVTKHGHIQQPTAPIPVPHPQGARHFFPSFGSATSQTETPNNLEINNDESPDNENQTSSTEFADQNINFCPRLRDAYEGVNPNVKNQRHSADQHQMSHDEVLYSIQNLQMKGNPQFLPGLVPHFGMPVRPYSTSKYSGSDARSEVSSVGSTPFKEQDETDEKRSEIEIKPLMDGFDRETGNTFVVAPDTFPRVGSSLSYRNERYSENFNGSSRSSEHSDSGRPSQRKGLQRSPSTGSDFDCSSITSANDLTITKGTSSPTRNGIKPPPPPTAILSKNGDYEVSHMDVLSEKIWHYHNKVSQTDEMLSRKLQLRDMLYASISPVFPMCGLYVVGSSLNGFGNNSSDMDLCLMITNKELDQKNDAVVVLNLILATLQYEKFVTSQKLILAKVPILRIKFADPFGDITVDLNANNSVAIRNTHLLCYYSSYDWRVRPLVSVVKEWAKRKGINDANKSSFTSYSLVLMVIHYLQCGTDPAVLPNLQKMYPNRFSNKVDVRTLNVTMTLECGGAGVERSGSSSGSSSPVEIPLSEDNTTLGELLIGFLDYYANQFDYDRDAISIRQGQRLERAVVARPKNMMGNGSSTPPPSSSVSSSSVHAAQSSSNMHQSMNNPQFQGAWRSQWRCVCIEEPFTNSNTAHSIYDEMVFGAIKDAFREAHTELQRNHDLDRLMECEPINVTIPSAGAVVYAALYEGERPAPHPIMIPSSINMRSQHGVTFYSYQPHQQQNGSQQSHQPPQQQQQQQQGGQSKNARSTQHFGNGNNRNGNGGGRRYNNQNSRSSRSNESMKDGNISKENLQNEGVQDKQNKKHKEDSKQTSRTEVSTPSPVPPSTSPVSVDITTTQ